MKENREKQDTEEDDRVSSSHATPYANKEKAPLVSTHKLMRRCMVWFQLSLFPLIRCPSARHSLHHTTPGVCEKCRQETESLKWGTLDKLSKKKKVTDAYGSIQEILFWIKEFCWWLRLGEDSWKNLFLQTSYIKTSQWNILSFAMFHMMHVFVHFLKNIYLFLREKKSANRGRAERGRHRILSRFHTISMEPDTGLKPMNRKIMTWAKIKSWTLNWLSHPGTLYCSFYESFLGFLGFNFFFNVYLFLRERKRERASRGGADRK